VFRQRGRHGDGSDYSAFDVDSSRTTSCAFLSSRRPMNFELRERFADCGLRDVSSRVSIEAKAH
jgi:hypothetical protein